MPTTNAAPDPVMSLSETRSVEKRQTKDEERLITFAQRFEKHAQVIRAPFTRESLTGTQDVAQLNEICEKMLGPEQKAQHLSAQIIDKDGKPILFYFSHRLETKNRKPPVSLNIL